MDNLSTHSVKAFQAEVDGLRRFINVHTTVFVLMSVVIVGVGLVMLFRLRTTPEHVLSRVSVIEKKLDEKLETRPADVAKQVQLTKKELSELIEAKAPWTKDRESWEEWREKVNAKLKVIEEKQ